MPRNRARSGNSLRLRQQVSARSINGVTTVTVHRLIGTPLRGRLRWLLLPCLLLVLLPIPGCALGVMAGKMFFGDPKLTAEFRAASGIDLTDGDHRVLIICNAPHGIRSRFPSLEIDVVDRMTRNLETRGISLISSDDVAAWYDDQGEWGDFSALAEHFDADFVINVELREFTYQVPDSPNLLQGTAEGRITAWRTDESTRRSARTAFDRTFKLIYPRTYPVTRENRSDDIFLQGFMDELALYLAQFLYDHRASESRA